VFELFHTLRCKGRVASTSDQSDYSEPLTLLGRGSGRLCYQHPFDLSLCIKIPRNARGRNESRREHRYIKLIELIHKEDTADRITRFHGRICTTAGTGWVVEKVLAEDNLSIAPQLHACLTPTAFQQEPENWTSAFNEFMNWCFSTAVVVRDASVTNICVIRLPSDQLRFILIDGIGPRGTLPQWVPIRWYARRRNRAYARASEFASIESLVSFCEKYQNDDQYHRDVLVDVPADPVRCLLPQ